MQYYIIHNENIMIANNPNPLITYGLPVQELPEDYEYGKYIVVDDELVLNPNWEEEKQEQQKQQRKLEIKNKIKELNEYSMDYMRIGDKAGLDIINNIISGLEVELTN